MCQRFFSLAKNLKSDFLANYCVSWQKLKHLRGSFPHYWKRTFLWQWKDLFLNLMLRKKEQWRLVYFHTYFFHITSFHRVLLDCIWNAPNFINFTFYDITPLKRKENRYILHWEFINIKWLWILLWMRQHVCVLKRVMLTLEPSQHKAIKKCKSNIRS